jgi:LPXTG-motif cell wall-anchored protein
MIAKQRTAGIINKLLVTGAALLAIAFTAQAQVQTMTSTAQSGAATTQVKIDRGEIVYVSGNSVVIKTDDGALHHFNNIPDSVTVTVDGKQLNVHQVQPGMKVERQTITTSTPRMITTVKTVTGTVWHVNPPNTVILTMENGKNQEFKIPSGQKFTIDGQVVDAFGLKKGMKVSAQKIIEQPEVVVAQEIKRSGTMPPPPPPPQADVPILIVVVPAAPAPVEKAEAVLPKTGSDLPLFGFIGTLLIGLGLALKTVRTLSR